MDKNKTMGKLMEEMRKKAGAREYSGHAYMDLARFADETRHMVIFDTLTEDCPVGWKGERTRLFITEEGYRRFCEHEKSKEIIIVSHATVNQGHLKYDHKEQVR